MHNADDPATGALVAEASLQPGCRVVSFTIGEPGADQLGVTDGRLIDRAFGDGSAQASGTVLADVTDITPSAPHNTAHA